MTKTDSIIFKRITNDTGIYRAGDWLVTHVDTNRYGKAINAPVTCRVRKTEFHGRYWHGSLAWTAEVIAPNYNGDPPTIIEGRYGSTRDEAVRHAVAAYREGVAA